MRRLLPVLGLILGILLLLLVLLRDNTQTPQLVEIYVNRPSTADNHPPPLSAPSYAEAVAQAIPAVVSIYIQHPAPTTGLSDDPNAAPLLASLGSGVIISPQGYLLTNLHVIEGATEIPIMLADGTILEATVVGRDRATDLALLKLPPQSDLTPIILGRSGNLRVGDVVLAIGNSYGVGQTVTQGIVSATGRTSLGISTFEDFIQTDAAINMGNSGGALINARGELVGINTAMLSRSGGSHGIGFAIPVDLAREVMTQLLHHGQVRRGWLGIEIQDLPATLISTRPDPGVLIANVIQDGPAQAAGISAGDIITMLDGQTVPDAKAALKLISQRKPGEAVQISGVRSGHPFTLTAVVTQRPEAD